MAEGEKTKQMDSGTTTVTVTVEETNEAPARSPKVVLKLTKSDTDKKVRWDQNTVDNENMNKKKSKCCCIYEKPKIFGESSDEEDDDHDCTNHCRGHKSKKDYRHDHDQSPDDPPNQPDGYAAAN